MKQADVDAAFRYTTTTMAAQRGLSSCTVANVVYEFLTRLIDRSGWLERQILRTVRGYVSSWMEDSGCKKVGG